MTATQEARYRRLIKDNAPRYVRCYDNGGETADRYTVTFPKVRTGSAGRYGYPYLGMSAAPFHPQGIGQHGESKDGIIDRPRYSHIGKKIAFHDLPRDCRNLVLRYYAAYWNLPLGELCSDCLRPTND